jgi:glycosyltransferase involved in cell wall biosynthesis
MPKVTLIVVNYNGRNFIRDCLNSLERQTFRDFEIILVDNASSDGSLIEIKKVVEVDIGLFCKSDLSP